MKDIRNKSFFSDSEEKKTECDLEESEWIVRSEQLLALRSHLPTKDALKNESLRKLLQEIDTTRDREAILVEKMEQDLDFCQFIDGILIAIGEKQTET